MFEIDPKKRMDIEQITKDLAVAQNLKDWV